MKISEILTKYAWDGPMGHGTDKNRCKKHGHCYGRLYDHLFSPFKDKKIDLVEIGIEHGASIVSWREYFTKANIIGIDIKDMVDDKTDGVEYIIEE